MCFFLILVLFSLSLDACNYLLVYEYIISSSLGSDSNDKWKGMSRAVEVKAVPDDRETSDEKKGEDINHILLLGGRRDGHICVFDKQTGKVIFEIEVRICFVIFVLYYWLAVWGILMDVVLTYCLTNIKMLKTNIYGFSEIL